MLPAAAVLRAARRAAAAGLGGADPVLSRLPGDYLDLRNQIVLAAETFTDPARRTGACYAAAGFACAGSTSGYARGAGGRGYAFHGQVKRCWLREVHRGGLAALGGAGAVGAV